MRLYFIKRLSLVLIISFIFGCFANAQDNTPTKSEATIELTYYKKSDKTKSVVAIVKARKDRKFVVAKNARVNFYVEYNKVIKFIKSATTDNKGKIILQLQNDLPLNDDRSFIITAKIENDSLYENVDEQIQYKEANLTLELDPYDTTRNVNAKLTEINKEGKEIPIKNAELKFYVQRMFGKMPASEENSVSTDENGKASFSFPQNIPGDTAGVITVLAELDDNKEFGNIESKSSTFWGTVLSKEKDPFPRALSEPHAPIQLIITISTLFCGIWITYFFIFHQLRRIKKEEDLQEID